jgi:hypothetical protein
MAADGTSRSHTVSVREASHALEALANLLFLASQHTDDGDMVRTFISEASSCIVKLTLFMKPLLAAPPQNLNRPGE